MVSVFSFAYHIKTDIDFCIWKNDHDKKQKKYKRNKSEDIPIVDKKQKINGKKQIICKTGNSRIQGLWCVGIYAAFSACSNI